MHKFTKIAVGITVLILLSPALLAGFVYSEYLSAFVAGKQLSEVLSNKLIAWYHND